MTKPNFCVKIKMQDENKLKGVAFMLPSELSEIYENILIEELQPAMGCTEPISIAYAGAIIRDMLGALPESVRIELSGNIIKNVKSVIVPATGGLHGIEAAAVAGFVSGRYDKRLEVLSVLTDADRKMLPELLGNMNIEVSELLSDCTFDLRITGKFGDHTATVQITGYHTNVKRAELDGETVLSKYVTVSESESTKNGANREKLTVKDIVEFAETADLTHIRPYLERQISLNMAIAEEGIKNKYGASIGRLLYRDGKASTKDLARAYAAAGSDARMSGCELPVCIISESGNQGITASVPVIVFAREKGIDEETLMRALIVSDLITVHQKTGIGCLSAYCGAISAGCGCGAGISYLTGGRFYEIAHTVVNAVAILSGTICDGAKPSCAAKIAMAVEAGFMGYEMVLNGSQFYGGDGIVTKGVENTIRNVGILAREGMSETDKEIIKIMLNN